MEAKFKGNKPKKASKKNKFNETDMVKLKHFLTPNVGKIVD